MYLPRYGLGNYVAPKPHKPPTPNEAKQLDDLSRAGKRLMGFCRTNLFKRLESSGDAFQQSLERHVLRNYIFLHAIENELPLPLGTQDAGLLDTANYDEDVDDQSADAELFSDGEDEDRQARCRTGSARRGGIPTQGAQIPIGCTLASTRSASNGSAPTFSSRN